MLILKKKTYNEWQDLRKRTEAALSVDTKEYYSLVKLLSEWTSSTSAINQFLRGEPERYSARLRDVLRRLKDRPQYPAIIDNHGKPAKILVAEVPYLKGTQIPNIPSPSKPEEPKMPPGWSRYSRFEDYREKLPPQLQQEGDENLVAWMKNRSRLHQTAKALEKEKADEATIAKVIAELDQQECCIQNYFDRVERFMNGEGEEEIPTNAKPSGRFTKAQIDQMKDPLFAAECKLRRIEANRKYISRKDMEYRPELELRKQELRDWNIDFD